MISQKIDNKKLALRENFFEPRKPGLGISVK